jgi:hypothetical protein
VSQKKHNAPPASRPIFLVSSKCISDSVSQDESGYEFYNLLHPFPIFTDELCFGDAGNEGVSKSFRTDHLERILQMVQLFATRCSCIAIL